MMCLVMIYVGLNVALASYAVFAPTIIRDLGFSALNAQLLSIPPYAAACILVFVSTLLMIVQVSRLIPTEKLVSWNSDRTLQRGYHIMAVSCLAIIGYIFLLATLNVGVRYAGAVLVACGVYPIIPLVSVSRSTITILNDSHVKRPCLGYQTTILGTQNVVLLLA